MIVLGNAEMRAAIDPCRGVEVRSLVDLRTGIEVLFQAPWPSWSARAPQASGGMWPNAWPGGWQVLFPNVGRGCRVDGRDHPFHGDAAVAAWTICGQTTQEITATWTDRSGLAATREIRLMNRSLMIATRLNNPTGAIQPFLFCEHVIFGGRLLAGHGNVEIRSGHIMQLGDIGEPVDSGVSDWPYVAGGGATEDWSRLDGGARTRLGTVMSVPDAVAKIASDLEDVRVKMTWSREALPFLRYWQEWGHTEAEPWCRRAYCLGLEPTSAAGADGLLAALGRGDATWLQAGEQWDAWVKVEIVDRV